MSQLGGLMKVLLGGLLAWAFVSGALGRFTGMVTSAVSGGAPAPASAAPAGAATPGTPASGGLA